MDRSMHERQDGTDEYEQGSELKMFDPCLQKHKSEQDEEREMDCVPLEEREKKVYLFPSCIFSFTQYDAKVKYFNGM